jgi:hypothetical protein
MMIPGLLWSGNSHFFIWSSLSLHPNPVSCTAGYGSRVFPLPVSVGGFFVHVDLHYLLQTIAIYNRLLERFILQNVVYILQFVR